MVFLSGDVGNTLYSGFVSEHPGTMMTPPVGLHHYARTLGSRGTQTPNILVPIFVSIMWAYSRASCKGTLPGAFVSCNSHSLGLPDGISTISSADGRTFLCLTIKYNSTSNYTFQFSLNLNDWENI